MTPLKIFYIILCIKLMWGYQPKHIGYDRNTRAYYPYGAQYQQRPSIVEQRNPNFYRPTPWVSPESKHNSQPPVKSSPCAENILRIAAEELKKRSCQNCKPSGNGWHGSVYYPLQMYSFNSGTASPNDSESDVPQWRHQQIATRSYRG